MTLLTGKGVLFFQLAAQATAGRAQLRGMTHSSGRSVIAHAKRQHKLRGTNEFVVEQLEAMVAGALAEREFQSGKITWEQLKAQFEALEFSELQVAFKRGTQEFA